MALMDWSSEYSVGVAELDEQHRGFIRMLNDYHKAAMFGQARTVAGPMFVRLIEIVEKHFSTEEAMMKAAKFPGLAQHCAKHRALLQQIQEFKARHEKGDHSIYVPLLLSARDWLKEHMVKEDSQYVPWMKGQGIH